MPGRKRISKTRRMKRGGWPWDKPLEKYPVSYAPANVYNQYETSREQSIPQMLQKPSSDSLDMVDSSQVGFDDINNLPPPSSSYRPPRFDISNWYPNKKRQPPNNIQNPAAVSRDVADYWLPMKKRGGSRRHKKSKSTKKRSSKRKSMKRAKRG